MSKPRVASALWGDGRVESFAPEAFHQTRRSPDPALSGSCRPILVRSLGPLAPLG